MDAPVDQVMPVQAEEGPTWMDQVIQYLKEGIAPTRKLRHRAFYYVMVGNELYKKGYSQTYLRCLSPIEADYVLKEIHEGVCRNHTAGRSLAHKAIRQSYH